MIVSLTPCTSVGSSIPLSVDDDGDAVDADEARALNGGAAVDSVRVAVLTVSIVEHTVQLNYTYQETPPRTAIGTQPVPMGMFRAEMSMPSRVLIRPLVTESTWLEFLTFWQHWADPVEVGTGALEVVVPVAAATATRRARGAKICMFGIERRRCSCGYGKVRVGWDEDSKAKPMSFYTRNPVAATQVPNFEKQQR
jgi:hypothetical protein